MRNGKVPSNCIRRLSVYYSAVNGLIESGEKSTSSAQLSTMVNVSPSLIRQDLNYFGAFGQHGCGYDLIKLRNVLSKILNIHNKKRMVLVGSGLLGLAMTELTESIDCGFFVTDAFGIGARPKGVKRTIAYHDITQLERIVERDGITTAALCVDDNLVESMIKQLVNDGVKHICNLSNKYFPNTIPGILIDNLNLFSSISEFGYHITCKDEINRIGWQVTTMQRQTTAIRL